LRDWECIAVKVQHIRNLASVFRDPRYIRVHGKPLFLVYRAGKLPNALETTTTWRREAKKLSIGELYLCRIEVAFLEPGTPGDLEATKQALLDAGVEK
jgi:hypothetical protein